MKSFFLILAVLAVQIAPQRASGAIDGSVVDSISMLPIANAPITLSTGTSQVDAITDQSGRFLIPNLAPGAYIVASTVDDYFGPEISTYV